MKISEYIIFFGLSDKSTLNFDKGPEFAGKTLSMAETSNVNVSSNSAYNPISNGSVEVSNRKIEQSLALTVLNDKNLVVSKLNHMPNENFYGLSPFEIFSIRQSP